MQIVRSKWCGDAEDGTAWCSNRCISEDKTMTTTTMMISFGWALYKSSVVAEWEHAYKKPPKQTHRHIHAYMT